MDPASELILSPLLEPALLRERVRQRIAQLSGAEWTDHNLHDPGISIVEVLSYALTDLGVRLSLDMPDLLAGKSDTALIPAREALSSEAFTLADYRRLLLEQPGVLQAWISAPAEAPAGLHQALLDMADPDNPGWYSLNEAWSNVAIDPPDPALPLLTRVYAVFPNWEQLPGIWSGEKDLTEIRLLNIQPAWDDEGVRQFYFEMELRFGEGGQAELVETNCWLRLPRLLTNEQEAEDAASLLAQRLIEDPGWLHDFQRKARRRAALLSDIRKTLSGRRNLCENWESVTTVRIQQIGVNAAVELSPEADADSVYANICLAVSRLLDPQPRLISRDEMRARGYSPDVLYQGPEGVLGGVFPDETLQPDPRRELVYISDIVRAIMEQPGVISVSSLSLVHFMDRILMADAVTNCLKLRNTREYKPKFSFFDSELRFFKQGLPVETSREALIRYEEAERGYRIRTALPDNPPPPPLGDAQLDIGRFYSILNEFPAIYGLREGEIMADAPPLRHAQTRQLSAYLLLFDQMMANFCSQLDHLPDIFSWELGNAQTYFSSAVKPPEDKPVLPDAYPKTLQNITEPLELFLQRKNRMLDHLMARFGENFSAYESWVLSRQHGRLSLDLIFDKMAFLEQMMELGSRRAQAFDSSASGPGNWDSLNVSGYEKRVAARLGMPDCRRRSLSHQFKPEDHLKLTGSGKFSLRKDGIGAALLTLYNPIQDESLVPRLGKDFSNYQIISSKSGDLYSYKLMAPEGAELANQPAYKSLADCYRSLRDTLYLLQGRYHEGMCVVEHILLKPAGPGTEPESLSFDNTGGDVFIPDPYACQLSIFLPGWAPRFQDPRFRKVVEQTLREELAAHLFPYIYWVELDEDHEVPVAFTNFENAWKAWLLDSDPAKREDLIRHFNELLQDNHVRQAYDYELMYIAG